MSLFPARRGTITLQPEMRNRVLAFMSDCKEQNLNVYITETRRSRARQYWLYAKGRILSLASEKAYLGYDDKNIYSQPRERKVTWTLNSNHLDGNAIDICFKTDTGITYSGPWEKVYDIAERWGLESLFRKHGFDRPHLNFLENWTPPDPAKKVRIAELEREFAQRSGDTHEALDIWNKVKEKLAKEKGVVYRPYKIT